MTAHETLSVRAMRERARGYRGKVARSACFVFASIARHIDTPISEDFLDGFPGKGGAIYDKHDGFCLETQHFPDAVNKGGTSGWDSVILLPGETYHHVMVHEFSTSDR